MSQKNTEVVREAVNSFNAFMRGELTPQATAEALDQVLDPQIEVSWQEERSVPSLPQRLHGAVELIGYAEERRSVELTLEPVEFIEAPNDRVVTPITQWFGGTENDGRFESHFTYVWSIRDGKVCRLEIFLRRDDALAAVGQGE